MNAVRSELGTLLARAWALLGQAADDPASPLRTPVVVSEGEDGPDGRVMVIRGCRPPNHLVFHTDIRSPKVAGLRRHARVVVVGYDPGQRLQLRVCGRAAIETEGSEVDAAWADTALAARRNYATLQPPGTFCAVSGDPRPETVDDAAARRNFARLLVAVTRIDWLELAADGHVRARFEHEDDAWTCSWRVP